MEPCTEEDYDDFFPVEESSAKRLRSLKEKNALLCLNFDKDYSLRGTESQGYFNVIDVMVVPCAVKLTLLGGESDRIPEDCEMDREESIKWLGNFNILSYYNQGRFNLEGFKEDRVDWSSYVKQNQMD